MTQADASRVQSTQVTSKSTENASHADIIVTRLVGEEICLPVASPLVRRALAIAMPMRWVPIRQSLEESSLI